MPYCQHRMIQNHPRSGEPHDLSNLFSHFRLIAMHFTVCTKRFFFHKWAFLASLFCIIRKSLTVRTHLSPLFFFFQMVFPAIQPYHLFHNILFFLSFLFSFIHLAIPLPYPPVILLATLRFLHAERNITSGTPKPPQYRFFQSVHSSCRENRLP